MQTEKFSLFIPIQIEKAGPGEDRYSNMRFKGIASNPNLGSDKQGHWLDPSGFELHEFLKSGTINFHHLWKDKPLAIIGEPTTARITKANELYVEGRLYKDSQMARDVYDLAEVMEKNSDTRRLGFSIEGTVLHKDPKNENRILKSKITQLAITPAPICPGTKMELMKGGLEDLKFEDTGEFLIDVTQDGIRYTVDKHLVLQKAMEAGAITGKETTDQSLTQEPLKKEDIDGVKGDKKKKKVKKQLLPEGESITKGEALAYLADVCDLDAPSCLRVYELAESIEKAAKGEGSKGGKIIGHTKSGKAVYEHHSHESYKEFSAQDHDDASELHNKKLDEHMDKIPSGTKVGAGGDDEKMANKHWEGRSKHIFRRDRKLKESGQTWNSLKKKHSTEQLTAHAENTSTARLKEVIKDESGDKGLRDAAKRELERRKPTK